MEGCMEKRGEGGVNRGGGGTQKKGIHFARNKFRGHTSLQKKLLPVGGEKGKREWERTTALVEKKVQSTSGGNILHKMIGRLGKKGKRK